MIAKYTMSPVFDKSGALNNAYKTNAFNTVPDKIHGLNFPYFVYVFATRTPMNGSLMASNTRAIIKIKPTNVACNPKIS